MANDLVVAAPTPNNVEAEYLLIASILFSPKHVERVADRLTAADFADPFLGRVYDLIVTNYAVGRPLTALSLRPLIEHDPSFAALGGNGWLASITNAAVTAVDAPGIARQLADLARRRGLLETLRAAINVCQRPDTELSLAVSAIDAGIATATATQVEAVEISGAKAMEQLLANAGQPQRAVMSEEMVALDKLIGGMRAAQMVIGAGRPGMGKTAVALSYGVGAAARGHGVLYVSLEMGAVELSARIAADMSFDGNKGAAYADVNSDKPSDHAKRAMASAVARLDDMPFEIVDAGTLTVGRLDMLIRRNKRRMAARGQSLDLVIVDYLQLLRPDDKMKSNYEAVSEISRRLKAMAKDHDVAMFALAQLSRGVEQREDKRPHLSDLRDSGQIEQDADAVVFFYRHEYYARQAIPAEDHKDYAMMVEAAERVAGQIDFICAKRRNGVTGTARGRFYGQYQAVRA